MTTKKRPPKFSSNRGGYRENAGRKSGWNHKDTCTIRIPKAFACELVELARRLDNGEKIDTDTESNLTGEDLTTQSKQVWPDGSYERCQQSEKRELIDIDTKSKGTDDDYVTKSLWNSSDSLNQSTFPSEKPEAIDIDTKSKGTDDDYVTKSLWNFSNSLTQPTFPLEKLEAIDIDTKSIVPQTDFVTESNLDVIENSQTSYLSVLGLQEALTHAKTIIKAKKSARESVARLLSKLYLAQVNPDDLS